MPFPRHGTQGVLHRAEGIARELVWAVDDVPVAS